MIIEPRAVSSAHETAHAVGGFHRSDPKRQRKERARKPNSVHQRRGFLRWRTIICLGRRSPGGSSTLPAATGDAFSRAGGLKSVACEAGRL